MNELSPSGRRREYPLFRYARPIIAMTIIFFSFIYLFAISFIKIPAENKDTVNLMTGFVLTMTAGVITYYFGTSKDKSDKDQQDLTDKA